MSIPRYDGTVLDNVPRPVPGATIYVLSQPTTSLEPPYSPLATIYSDNAGSDSLSNPFYADGNGNYYFYAAAGTYTVVITGGTLASPIILPDQQLINSVSGVTLQTDGTNNSTQTLLNLAEGTGIALAESGGTVTITATAPLTLETNGTQNGSQTLLNLQSGGGVTLVDDGSGDITITATAGTTFRANGSNLSNQSLVDFRGSGITITPNSDGTLTFTGLPIYLSNGDIPGNAKVVYGSASLSGGSVTVTLTGAAIFTSSSSYQVIANLPVSVASGSSFTINGSSTPAGVISLNVSSNVLTVTANQLFTSGQVLTFSSLNTGAAFLNGQNVTVDTAYASGSNFIFTAPFTNADYGITATISNVALTSNVVTITTSATHTFSVGSQVAISGVTTATWLNGQTLTITAVTGTTFDAAFTHGDYGSASDTGSVTDADTGYVNSFQGGTVSWIAVGQ